MILVTVLVTVSTHTNTLYPAKRRKEAHKRVLNAASRTIPQSLSDAKNPVVLISRINSVPTSDTISQWPFRTTTVPQPRVSPCPFMSPESLIKARFCLPVSLPVPHCTSLSVKENDYEQRRSQVRVLPSAPHRYPRLVAGATLHFLWWSTSNFRRSSESVEALLSTRWSARSLFR